MNWQEIMEQVLEINQLQDQVLIKSQSEIIKQIINKKQKYFNNKCVDLKSLNNAVLEHKLKLTPYQIIIIEKINSLSLNTNIKQIYINMPDSQEEAEKYVKQLKEKYQLAINCFNLIIDIEKISETEYVFDYPFENSIYAKRTDLENELFFYCMLNTNVKNQEKLILIISNKQKQFMNSLSKEENKKLLVESLALSYDRNVYDYFNGQSNILKAARNTSIESAEVIYNNYKNLLINLNNINLSKISLSKIYNHFKIIYETEFFNQKIKKK